MKYLLVFILTLVGFVMSFYSFTVEKFKFEWYVMGVSICMFVEPLYKYLNKKS